MKKPTCETCVYFEKSEQFFPYDYDGSFDVKSRDGLCCRWPETCEKMLHDRWGFAINCTKFSLCTAYGIPLHFPIITDPVAEVCSNYTVCECGNTK